MQLRIFVFQMLFCIGESLHTSAWAAPVHRKASPAVLSILPSCQNEQDSTHFVLILLYQVESSGVFKFWTELLFLCLVWVCPGGLKGLWAQFCISSWSQQPHQGPSRCTPSILLRGWFLSPDRVNAVAVPHKRGRACPAIL